MRKRVEKMSAATPGTRYLNHPGVIVNAPAEQDPAVRDDSERCAAAILRRRRDAMFTGAAADRYCVVDFRADVWDFTPMYPDRARQRLVLNFDVVPTPRIRRFVKFWLRYCYEESGVKPMTLYSYLRTITFILSRIVRAPGAVHDELDLITTEDVFAECTRENIVRPGEETTSGTRGLYFRICWSFWRYCNDVCRMGFPVSVKALEEWHSHYNDLANLEENRTPDIPDEYYRAILAKSLEVMRAEPGKHQFNDVRTACVLVILTQTGMRIGDALALKTGDLKEAVVERTGERTAVLEFGSSKPTRGHGQPLRFTIFASPICEEAFRRLLALREGTPTGRATDILVVPRRELRDRPYCPKGFREVTETFFMHYLQQYCLRPWPGITPHLHNNHRLRGFRTELWIPGAQQYRVHLCSYLYSKGVDIVIIEKHLAHLSEIMYGYYIRMKDDRDKLAGFGEKFIEDYVRSGYQVSEPEGAKVQAEVLKFLETKNVTVNSSYDEILAALKGAVTVRQKGVGYCVRASFTPCSQEPTGNRLLCTYGMCPNYVTLFHAADATLSVFRGHMAACRLNLAAGHRNAAAKELCDARQTAERHLLPQLRALERESAALGRDEILRRHPHLEEIVFNLSEIKREVTEALKTVIPGK